MNGPYETEREARTAAHAVIPPEGGWSVLLAPQNRQLLERTCEAAGVELGVYDRRILGWLAGFEDSVCAVVAGLVARGHASGAAAHQAGEDAKASCAQCGSPVIPYTDPYDGRSPRWRHLQQPDEVAQFLDAEHGAEPAGGTQ